MKQKTKPKINSPLIDREGVWMRVRIPKEANAQLDKLKASKTLETGQKLNKEIILTEFLSEKLMELKF